MSNSKDYTIGWICAIRTEYVAAQSFLDAKHEGPEYVSPNDNNDYTLGKIGKHNVVMAVLPDGEYGISSAASVARDMLHSFPNVRIGLMVGVGGGAPSPKHDIRLGDVVVSAPRNGKGGVFQYDFGKMIQGQDLKETGFLDQPPTVLRTAMNGLMAQYESEGHQLEETINSILERKSRLRKNYKRPDVSNDRLYQSAVIHPPNNEASCAVVCSDPSTLILRPERTEDEDNPAIHYGLIASGNQLIKDALFRDKFSHDKDILCFDMEAAGLMNHFPCLVIRGICDYSDTHKNKEWQGYAAMAAAAYTKDLLCRIPPNKVEAERKIGDIVSAVQGGVNELLHAQHDQEHETILKWLTPINGIDYNSQQNDYIIRRQHGTGQWFLESREFQTWLNTDNQTLFCPGIPGAGKTIMTSIIIEYLQSNYTDSNIAYIYCNIELRDKQIPTVMLESVLKQLVQKQSPLPQGVKDLYERHKDKQSRPRLQELSEVLQSVISPGSRTFIIIDALDECQNHDKCRSKLLSEIFTLQSKTQLNLLATSRPQEVEATFSGCISREIHATREDINAYLDEQISRWETSHHDTIDKDLRDMIKSEISSAANEMFLLATLNMNAIKIKPTKGAIKDSLQNLAENLEQAYKQTMKRVQSQEKDHKELAEYVLQWIIYAKRPLSTAELPHAIAVRLHTTKLDEDYLPTVHTLLSVCAGLVRLEEKSRVIGLVHETTRAYFEKTKATWFPDAETNIATTCICRVEEGESTMQRSEQRVRKK